MCRCQRRCYIYTTTVFAILAAIFIITGSVLVAKNDKKNNFLGDLDDLMETQLGGGIAMICFGIIFAIVAIITGGCLYCNGSKGTNRPQSFDQQSHTTPTGGQTNLGIVKPPYPGTLPESQMQAPYLYAEPPSYKAVMEPQMPEPTKTIYLQDADATPSAPVKYDD